MDQKALKAVTSPAAACGGRWETRLELPIETELLIPDYLPAVFKIVKCLVEPVVMQNAVTGQRWQGEGYLRCTVYYQSDEAGTRLYRTEQKYAFEKTAELPEGSYLQGAARLRGRSGCGNGQWWTTGCDGGGDRSGALTVEAVWKLRRKAGIFVAATQYGGRMQGLLHYAGGFAPRSPAGQQ